jgi:L-ascorbate metabolism protein UlaG (beta-lactamase superfamily)
LYEEEIVMKIKWLGHAAFVLTTDKGQVILTDPYEPDCFGGSLKYAMITVTPDIITVSHDHADHNCALSAFSGKPRLIKQDGNYDVAGIRIKGIPSFHDMRQGKERGKNIIFVYQIDDLNIVHLGDLGHVPTLEQCAEIGPVDVLLIPVGGYFTIDAVQAAEIARGLKARIVIPMHYKTDKVSLPIAPVDEFLVNKKVKRLTTAEVTLDPAGLPPEQEVWVLPYQN